MGTDNNKGFMTKQQNIIHQLGLVNMLNHRQVNIHGGLRG